MRFLLSLIFCFFPLFSFAEEYSEDNVILSTPEQIATLNSESSHLVGGLVSPLSGQLALKQTDLIVKGAQSLHLSHLYIPPIIPTSFPQHKKHQAEWNNFYLAQHLINNYKGWVFLPHMYLEYFSGSNQIRLSDPSGTTLDFRLVGQGELATQPYAISNVSGEVPSGKYDPRNTRIVCDSAGSIKVSAPDGTIRLYGNRYRTTSGHIIFLLLKEILPNGKVLRYGYNGNQLTIEAKDPQERFTYATIHVKNGLNRSGGSIAFSSSSGINSHYAYIRRSLPAKIKENSSDGESAQKIEWNPTLPPLLIGASTPFFRKEALSYDSNFLLTGYSGKDHLFTCNYGGFGSKDKHFKAQTLSFPVGPNETFQPVYAFHYEPAIPGQSPGYTIVNNPDGTFTRYDFSASLLMTTIQWFDEKRQLKKQKTLSWTDQHYLSAIQITDGEGILLHRKTFEYDSFGNPIVETLQGVLTRKGCYETYAIEREFSQDGKNLLLKQTENGKITLWEYLPGTNLITIKLIKDNDQIFLREFYQYDDSNNLIQSIHDDGCGKDPTDLSEVSQRTIKTYHLRQQAPYLHMPEWIEERYWDNREEKLLKKTQLIYDPHGNVKEEQIYGSDGNFAYTIYKTYNERGDILSETNPLGDKIFHDYDERGRLTYHNNFSDRLHTTLAYDKQGRLKEKAETGEDLKHLHTYEYDRFDQLTAKTDPFENYTSYAYDPIAHQVEKTTFPCIESQGQSVAVQTHASYDPLGNRLTQTNANGDVTIYTYNAYGSPTHVTLPDGAQEHYTYTTDGQLASQTDPDGLTIQYQRDTLGRVLSKRYIDTSGETIAEETFTYNGFNLLRHTNKEEHTKHYFYDGAGRKVKEEFCGKTTCFTYDPLGFLEKVIQENGINTLVTTYTRDFLGQILKEEKSDTSGNLLHKKAYTYDPSGNQKTFSRFINGKEATETFLYDPLGRITSLTDALGYQTTKTYKEDHLNLIGQKVLQTTVTDSLHTSRLKTYDSFGKLAEEETLNPNKQTIAKHQNTYDPSGNLISRTDEVYEGTDYIDTQWIQHTYNPRGQLASTTRGYGTSDPRTTTYTYTPAGKLQTKTTPNQISLTYEYDPLGYLNTLTSSDGEIDHTFDYNREGHLVIALDENLDLTIEREVDPFGNVTKELFPNNLQIEKEYDALDRPSIVDLNNMGSIHYVYDPLFLREISRYSPEGSFLYTHEYTSYDLSGNILSENLIYNLGSIKYDFDLKGRKTLLSTPYFQETVSYDPCNNLKQKISEHKTYEYTYDDLHQLTSEKKNGLLISHEYDSLQNFTKKNFQPTEISPLNELLSLGTIECDYDLNGNQILKESPEETLEFNYDSLDRLISVSGKDFEIFFSYDPLGRRLSKKVLKKGFFGTSESLEYYLYDGEEEIGALSERKSLKNLKVLGATCCQPIAIELDGYLFAPILDLHGNVQKLIDPYKRIHATYHYSAFGEEQNTQEFSNPWRYFSKRLDPETGLIYFGKRDYDPQLARWLTTDPSGFTDSMNLYQYTLNNPFRYYDPHGQFLFVLPLIPIIMGTATVAEIITGAAAIAIASWATYEAAKTLDQWINKSDTVNETEKIPDVQTEVKDKKKKGNTNPFEGAVGEDVVVVDPQGNAIPVKEGNWLGGSKDGTWIQERELGVKPEGDPTGFRKDGGGHPRETDIRGRDPHAHVPGITNPDGTPWLPIN